MTQSLRFIISVLICGWFAKTLSASCGDEEDWYNFKQQLESGHSINTPCFNLQARNLNHHDLTNAKLRRVDFRYAQLRHTNFSKADLTQADFRYADLTGANLNQAILNGARFEGARLHDIVYKNIQSAKGTLFEDPMTLLSRVHDDSNENHFLEKQNDDRFSIVLTGTQSLKSIY